MGLLVFLYGLFTMHSNQLATEVCNSGGEFNMCPLCDIDVGCNFWNLSEVCSYAQLAYLFDHPGTVFYAVFVSFWGECTLKYHGDLQGGCRPQTVRLSCIRNRSIN